MPAAVILALQAIQALITAAPQIESIVKAGHDLITAMFTNQLITKDQQDTLHAWVDLQAKMDAQGIPSPAWAVEADPK